MTHFLYTPFTGLGLYNGYRGDTWLKNRIKIFKQFVLPSILNQTNKDFILLVSWRPEDENNPIVKDFKESLDNIRDLKTVFTYHGILFWDDKYDDIAASEKLLESLKRTLPELESFVDGEVLFTIQPSDDMYVSDVVERTQKFFKENEEDVMGFRQGYIINYATKEIAEYNPTTTPPFYTIKFSKEIFSNPMLHYDFIGPYKSHEYVKDVLPAYYFYERSFVVGTHNENISTHFDHPFKGKTLLPREQESVLIDVGNYFTPSLEVKKDLYRRCMKKALNILPAIIQRKVICYLSTPKVENAIKNYNYFNL